MCKIPSLTDEVLTLCKKFTDPPSAGFLLLPDKIKQFGFELHFSLIPFRIY